MVERVARGGVPTAKEQLLLHAAVSGGNKAEVTRLLKMGFDPSLPNAKDHGVTPLMAAVRVPASLAIARELVLYQADMEAKDDLFGDTALTHAAFHGRADIVGLLVEAHADLNYFRATDKYTALMLAVANEHNDVAALLLAGDVGNNPKAPRAELGCAVDVLDDNRWSALHHACENDNAEACRLLLAAGADPDVDAVDKATALIRAACCGHADCVRAMIDGGADLNERTADGTTGLIFAARRGFEECCKLMIEPGGTGVKSANRKGETAVSAAVAGGHAGVVRLLMPDTIKDLRRVYRDDERFAERRAQRDAALEIISEKVADAKALAEIRKNSPFGGPAPKFN